MIIHLIAAGRRMPDWIAKGYLEYQKRLPSECNLNLIETEIVKRGKNSDIEKLKVDEGRRLLSAIPKDTRVIALDVTGNAITTSELAHHLEIWMGDRQNIAILVGGPDGLSAECIDRSSMVWSLSPLTFPHALVRIIVAEQIYRAWSICRKHPYHRG